MSNSFIQPIDSTLSGDTPTGQSQPVSDSNERVLCISERSSITEASPLNYLVSYLGANGVLVLPFRKFAVSAFCTSGRLGHRKNRWSNIIFEQIILDNRGSTVF